MYVNADECAAAGLDPEAVGRLARRLERAALDAGRMGLVVFGGTASGSLRFDDGHSRKLIVAGVSGPWDGGCGAEIDGDDGLVRGE